MARKKARKSKAKKKAPSPKKEVAPVPPTRTEPLKNDEERRLDELKGLTPEEVVDKARNKRFKDGRARAEEVELATLQVLIEIRDALKR